MKTFSVIMAGGGGKRFWPLSRQETPKQLLNLSGKDVMVNETIDRLFSVSGKDDIFIVTNSKQVKKMKEVTKEKINISHILSEPVGRNTAACIGYAALKIYHEYGDGVLVVTPSDAYVRDVKEYGRVLQVAVGKALETSEIVTIGIKPTFAATGYGYIHFKKGNEEVKKALRFVEKPNQETADEYFASGEYAWNSGIFVWKVSTVIKKFKELLPDIYADLEKIANSFGTKDEERITNEVYPQIRSISIDYGVMEKSNDIWVVSGDFGWNDVGSWDMLKVIHEEDNEGNIKIGKVVTVDSTNSIFYGKDKVITAVGIDNLIVIDSGDAIMICPKDKAQDVKKIVDVLEEKGIKELL